MHFHNIRITPDGMSIGSIEIGRNVIVGAGSVIHQNVTIGSGSIIRNRTWVGLSVPEKSELLGSPPELSVLNCQTISEPSNQIIHNIICVAISILIQLFRALWLVGIMILSSYSNPVVFPIGLMICLILDGLVFAVIVRMLPAVKTMQYGSWDYFWSQRVRLLIGREVKWGAWGFTVFQQYLLRLAGLNRHTNVECAGPIMPNFQIPFRFIELQKGSTLTSGVWIGEEVWRDNLFTIKPVCIGENSFVGDTGAVLSGVVADQSIVGSQAIFCSGEQDKRKNLVTIGNNTTVQYPEQDLFGTIQTTYANSIRRHIIEGIMLLVSLSLSSITSAILAIVTVFFNQNTFIAQLEYMLIADTLSIVIGFCLVLFGRLLMGQFKEETKEMYSSWFYKREFYYQLLFNWIGNQMWMFNSTEIQNMFLRMFGANIGKRVLISGPECLLELDIVSIGDDTIIESGAIVQPHTFEARKMAVKPVRIGCNCVIGAESIVLAGAEVKENVIIEARSLVLKNQIVSDMYMGGGMLTRYGWMTESKELSRISVII